MAAVLIFSFRLRPEEPEIRKLRKAAEALLYILRHDVRVRVRRVDDRQRLLPAIQILHFPGGQPADPHVDERRLWHHRAPVLARDGHERRDTLLRETLCKLSSLCRSAENQYSAHNFSSVC